jgi:hypothetical protein
MKRYGKKKGEYVYGATVGGEDKLKTNEMHF